MAEKVISAKIKIDGSEVEITKDNLTLLSKTIDALKGQLTDMGTKTRENASAWDELSNSIQQLEGDYQSLTNAQNANTDAAKENDEELKSLAEQIGKLEDKMGQMVLAGQQNTEEYKKLAQEARKLRDAQEDVAIASTKLVDVMAGIPGPIGFIFGGVKSLQVGLKSAKTALGNFGLSFKALDKAIASTGIGAIIVAIGLLVGAIVKAISKSKVWQEGMERIGKATEIFGDILQPIIDFIANVAIAVIEGLAKALLWLTGNLEKYNQEVADAEASKKFAANVEYQGKLLEASAHKYDEYTLRKMQANQKYNEQKLALDKDETLSEQQKYRLMTLYREQANAEIAKADQDRKAKADADRKAAADKARAAAQERLNIEKDYQNRLRSLQEEYFLLGIEDEKTREQAQLTFQYRAQLREIDLLKITEKKKQELRDAAQAVYEAKQKDITDKYLQQKKDEYDRLRQLTEDNQVALIKDEEMREKAAEELRYDREKKRLEKLLKDNEENFQAVIYYNTLLEQEKDRHYQVLDALDEKRAQKEKEILKEQLAFDASVREAQVDLAFQAASLIGQVLTMNGKNAKAGVLIEKGMAIGQVLIDRSRGNAAAAASAAPLLANPITAGPAAATLASARLTNNISAGLSIASIIAAAAQSIAQINAASQGDSGGGGGKNLGRNYAQGGIISGPGGPTSDSIGINVSNGEAIMSAGAVGMFAPMLSMMNQLGGGAPFGNSAVRGLPDAPRRETPALNNTAAVIKTYVVEGELTSMQQKQARLKDLSTL